MTITIQHSAVLKQAVLNITIPYKGHASWHTFQSLASGTPDQHWHKGSEQSVLLWSLFKHLELKISGSPVDEFRNKFADLKCTLQQHALVVTVKTQSTLSAARKVLGVVAKNLQPAKTAQLYRKYVTQCSQKVDAEHFVHICNELVAGVKDASVFVVGPMKLDAEKEKQLKDTWAGKLDASKADGKAKAVAETGRDAEPELHGAHLLKVASRFDALLARDYMGACGVDARPTPDGLAVLTGSQSWDALKNKVHDAERIKRFVQQKVAVLKERVHDVLVATMALDGHMTASELAKIPKQHTEAVLAAAIKKAF